KRRTSFDFSFGPMSVHEFYEKDIADGRSPFDCTLSPPCGRPNQHRWDGYPGRRLRKSGGHSPFCPLEPTDDRVLQQQLLRGLPEYRYRSGEPHKHLRDAPHRESHRHSGCCVFRHRRVLRHDGLSGNLFNLPAAWFVSLFNRLWLLDHRVGNAEPVLLDWADVLGTWLATWCLGHAAY